MPLPDAVFLGHMLHAIDRLSDLVARTDRDRFNRDWVVQDAVIRELEVLGEAAGHFRLSSLHPIRRFRGVRSRASDTSSFTIISWWILASCGAPPR